MKKLKIDELKIQSFVTSFATEEKADQLIGGSVAQNCTNDPNCTNNCNTTDTCGYHTTNCHAVTAPVDNCSVQYCYSVNASNCAGGENCYIDGDGGYPV